MPSDGCGFRKETVAGTRGKERDAGPDLRALALRNGRWIHNSHSPPCRLAVGDRVEDNGHPNRRPWPPAHVSSSSNAFASLRSALLKPSVNQPDTGLELDSSVSAVLTTPRRVK